MYEMFLTCKRAYVGFARMELRKVFRAGDICVYIYIYILFEAMRYDEIFQRVGIDIGEGQGQSPQILLEFRQKKESQQKRLKSTTDP